MNLKLLATVFTTIFLAELGDKTQLATLLYAADARHSRWTVFFGSSLALVSTSALGVLVGGWIGAHVGPRTLGWVAGLGFIAIGVWTIWKA